MPWVRAADGPPRGRARAGGEVDVAQAATMEDVGPLPGRQVVADGPEPEPAPAAAPRLRSPFWLAVWLGVALVVPKVMHVGLPQSATRDALFRWFVDLAVATHADVLFALAVGWLGQILLWLTRRAPRCRAVLWLGWVGLCLACVVYVVVSVQVYRFLRTPLTYSLIYLAGDMGDMASSVGAFVTPALVAALVLAPACYLTLAVVCQRRLRARRDGGAVRWARRAIAVVLTGVVLYHGHWGHKVLDLYWHWRVDHRIAENPHWALISSCLAELAGGRPAVRLDAEFSPDDASDFARTAGTALPPSTAPAATRPLLGRNRPRNVILVVLESVAAQHLGLYGGRYPTTPNLQAELAAGNCLVVDHCYANVGKSAGSLVALTASRYPSISVRQDTAEHPDLPAVTLPQLLGPAGYRTVFLTSGDFRYADMGRFLATRGFDNVWDFRHIGHPKTFSWGVEDRFLFDALREWVDREPGKPFFAFAWTVQTHHPYAPSPGRPAGDFFAGQDPPPPEREALGRYLTLLREADQHLADLFAWLRRRGLADDTLVVVTGDHGEAFGDPHATFAHGMHLYDENVRVPLIFWNPGIAAAGGGGRMHRVVGHVDVTPTIAHALGMAPAPGWQGRSLFDPARAQRAYFFAADHDYMLGLREDRWKYVYNATTGFEELFDLSADPREQTNVAPHFPDRDRRMRQRLSAWLDHQRRQAVPPAR